MDIRFDFFKKKEQRLCIIYLKINFEPIFKRKSRISEQIIYEIHKSIYSFSHDFKLRRQTTTSE